MATTVDRLTELEDLLACEKLQRTLLGERARSILAVPTLAAIRRSSGLLLGAWETDGDRRLLRGALVDLVANADGYPARFSVFLGVDPAFVNRGIAQSLRAAERAICVEEGVDLVFWLSDPLAGDASHVALNKLGAIATAHTRNALGPLDDRANRGLASDRLRVEWWVNSPRVVGILDQQLFPPHYDLGFERMQVITRTTGGVPGLRRLVGVDETPKKDFILIEVPSDLARLRERDPAGAREWRLKSREAFELLFDGGYTIVGFIHEGGRSFHLFEHADRADILGRHQSA